MERPLFHREGELIDFFETQNRSIKREIESYERKLLNVNEEELVRYLIERYTQYPPILKDDEKYICRDEENDVDVSRDRMRAIFDRSRPSYIKGISVTVAIPFDGDPNLFYYTPSTYTYSSPHGDIIGQEIHLTYTRAEHNAEELNKTIERDIDNIKQYLGWVQRDAENFNKSLEPFIRDSIRSRKAKLQKDIDLVTQLGIPIKRRAGMPETYVAPEIRRKPKILKRHLTEKPFKPEPILEMEEYENILSILKNMVLVMERSPKAFVTMKEEDIRQHFLVQLNAQYEGSATGETFNYQGKTDILIRHEGKNVFIAECKFWKGEKALVETINQLLGYTSWRDTKTAILLFNRGKNFSTVLEKVPGIIKSHGCYKRDLGVKAETEFRFIFHQPDDPNRELILTVLAFNVPVPEEDSSSK
jgi:hypothetical protein